MSVTFTRASQVTESDVEWVWPRRIPLGELTVLAGDPGIGKSTAVLDIVARVTTGRPMPDGTGAGLPRNVIVLSGEDSWEHTIVPRLRIAGADLENVGFFTIDDEEGGRDPEISAKDAIEIEDAVRQSSAHLLVLDCLNDYLPATTDTHNDHSVRRPLTILRGIAARCMCGVVGLGHLGKSAQGNSLYRVLGSIGNTGKPRSVLLVGVDPDDPETRVLMHRKTTIGVLAPSLEYRLVSVHGEDHARVEWGGVSRHTADSLLSPPKDQSEVESARDFLLERLADGPVSSVIVQEEWTDEGGSVPTLRRAKKLAGVEAIKAPTGDHWVWSLNVIKMTTTPTPDHLPMTGTDPDEHLRGRRR